MKKRLLLLTAAIAMLLGTLSVPMVALDGGPGPNCSPTGSACKP